MYYHKTMKTIKRHIQENFILYFILTFLFIAGNIIAPLLFKQLSQRSNEFILKLINPSVLNLNVEEYTYGVIFRSRFIYNIILVIALLTLSFFGLGTYLIPVLIIWEGISIGYLVAYLVNNFHLKGFIAAILGVYPQSVFLILPFIGIGALSMSISSNLRMQRNKSVYGIHNLYIKEYLWIILFYTFFILLASLLEGVLLGSMLKFILRSYI